MLYDCLWKCFDTKPIEWILVFFSKHTAFSDVPRQNGKSAIKGPVMKKKTWKNSNEIYTLTFDKQFKVKIIYGN